MNSERWKEVERIYQAALERKPQNRSSYLDEACGTDAELRQEIESLLSYQSQAENFIESPALEIAAKIAAQEKATAQIGRKIGPYEILSFIGAGGMGEIYLAKDIRLGRKVAMKLLPHQFTEDTENVGRFEREARAASSLNHPNILTIYDIGKIEDTHYIATEYIEGQTLRQHLTKTLEIETIIDIGMQVAGALSEAHRAGIVHRDIKPENIMIRQDGLTKVLDFGLAKLTQKPAEQNSQIVNEDIKTETGAVLGTPRYMSPEQARGVQLDGRADLFSLGIVLYEMVSLQPPFQGDTLADTIASLIGSEPPSLSQIRTEIPPALDWIIRKVLRKDRDERYQNAEDLLNDLKILKSRMEFEKVAAKTGKNWNSEIPGLSSESVSRVQKKQKKRKQIDSLAILPQGNATADPDLEYLSDGISESIISNLAHSPALRVLAWSTVSRYKNRRIDPRELGREFDVRAVLIVRVHQLGERWIIKIELVDATDGSHLWSEKYTFHINELAAIETEIAKDVSAKLLVRFTAKDKIEKPPTENVEAHRSYLKGRYYWNKRTEENVRKAMDYFSEAIELDPSYALPYAGLADCYIILGSFGIALLNPKEAFLKARDAATKALEIDETLAEAHASLGSCLTQYFWDFNKAEKEFQRSFALKPGYATAHHWYGFIYLTANGQLEEAIREVRKAHDLDPLSLSIGTDIGLLNYLARRYDQTIQECLKTVEMDPQFAYAHWKLGLAYEQKQMYSEAISSFEKAISLYGKSALPKALLAHALAISEHEAAARQILTALLHEESGMYVSPYRIAAIYEGLAETDAAFEWLHRAYEERDPWIHWLKFDPIFDGIRNDQRYKDLEQNIGSNSASRTAKVLRPLHGSQQSMVRKPYQVIRSLAVMPLVNLSAEPDMEYLGDGITEWMINILSQLPELRVIARNTVFRYKNREVMPEEIASSLNVETMLTGRVRLIGDDFLISVELIDTKAGSQLWGQSFHRKLTDIFKIQEEIAQEITDKLKLKLTRKEKGRLKKRQTEHLEAYHLYLKGKYFCSKRTGESIQKSVQFFQKAIDLDPVYAAAYSGLSDAFTLLVIYENLSPQEGFAKAKAAANKALSIDDSLGEAYASLAHAMLHNREWDSASQIFRRAIELNPGYPSAHHWYSEYFVAMGNLPEAISEVKRAADLDPLSPAIHAHVACLYYFDGQWDECIHQCKKILEMEPSYPLAKMTMAPALAQKGKYEEALAIIQPLDSPKKLSLAGYIHAKSGNHNRAEEVLQELRSQANERPNLAIGIATILASLKQFDEAFQWLDHAYLQQDGGLFEIKVEPMFEPLHSDPRFDALMKRIFG